MTVMDNYVPSAFAEHAQATLPGCLYHYTTKLVCLASLRRPSYGQRKFNI